MNHFSRNLNKFQIFSWFFTEKLTLLFYVTVFLPVLRCVGHNTDLLSNSNISKTVRINIAFATAPFKEYSTRFFMVCRLIDFALVVLKLLIFQVCVIIGISKIEFFNFSSTERVKKNQKNSKPFETS